MNRLNLAAAALLTLLSTPLFAHAGGGLAAAGLAEGFLHPITGIDHVVAMVGVGIWGAVLGRPALWILPLAFPLMMAVGGALGIAGAPLPYVEVVIAASGVVIGTAIAVHRKTFLPVAILLVGIFAIFHGYAHGAEAPATADPFAYCLGFVVGTGLMHICGIALGHFDRRPVGQKVVRVVGGLIAATGAYFLLA